MLVFFRKRFNNLRKYIHHLIRPKQERQLLDIAQKITNKHLTYLGINVLYELAHIAADNEKSRLEGAIVETGCALGGSAIMLAHAKSTARKLFIYDTFSLIPAPSARDGQDVHNRYEVIQSGKSLGIENDPYYGYMQNLYDKVVENFVSFGLELGENNIYLVQGLYEKTLKIEFPVSLAHIDCDWYESVFISLKRIEPNLVRGGTLVIDDYYAYSGCRNAVDEYFKDKQDAFIFINKSRLHIIKK